MSRREQRLNSSDSHEAPRGTPAALTTNHKREQTPMNNDEFETIDLAHLDSINGGNKGRAIANGVKKAGGWLWRNVVGPMGGGALYDWATGGGNNNQQPQQPQGGQQ